MKEIFLQAANNIDFPAIRDWKDKGKKIVGYTCSFLPVEIVYAADILPVRLRGINPSGLGVGDAYYGPFVCSFPKAILQLAGEGRFKFLDGAVISTGCDTMRRLDECWRKAGEDINGILPSFFHYFDIPHKTEAHAFRWFLDEIKKLITSLEDHFSVKILEKDLLASIKIQNQIRSLLKRLDTLRTGKDIKLSGTEFYAAVIAGSVMPRDIFVKELEEWIAELEVKNESPYGDRKRILVTGSVCDDLDLIRLIEDCGAVVAAENICFGLRNENDYVREDKDPVTALAERYLTNSVCPRMFGGYRDRLKSLTDKVKRAGIDGIIVQNVRFCELHSAENGLFERDLAEMGVPVLRLEREYGPLTETGRMKMRFDAFLERISRNRSRDET